MGSQVRTTGASVEPVAFEMRAERLSTRFSGAAVRMGERDQLKIGSGGMIDYVLGGENTRVTGNYSESFPTFTHRCNQIDTLVDGKMSLRTTQDNVILGGVLTQHNVGATLITSGMSDALMAGAGIRITVPSDIWLAGLIGLEEKMGTACADGALVEISVTHFEREYLTALYSIGACTRTGSVYVTLKTGAFSLLKVSANIRTLTAGSGGVFSPEGGGQAPDIASQAVGPVPVSPVDNPIAGGTGVIVRPDGTVFKPNFAGGYTRPALQSVTAPSEVDILLATRQVADFGDVADEAATVLATTGSEFGHLERAQRAEDSAMLAEWALDSLVAKTATATSTRTISENEDLVSLASRLSNFVANSEDGRRLFDADSIQGFQLTIGGLGASDELGATDEFRKLDILRQLTGAEDVEDLSVALQVDEIGTITQAEDISTITQAEDIGDLGGAIGRGDDAEDAAPKSILKKPNSNSGEAKKVAWGENTSFTIPDKFSSTPQAPQTNIQDGFNFNDTYAAFSNRVTGATPDASWDDLDWARHSSYKDTLATLDNAAMDIARRNVGKYIEEGFITEGMNVLEVRDLLEQIKTEVTTSDVSRRLAGRVYRAASESIDYIDDIVTTLLANADLADELIENGDVFPLSNRLKRDDVLEVVGGFDEALSTGTSKYGDPFANARQGQRYQFDDGLALAAVEDAYDLLDKGGNPLPAIDNRIDYIKQLVTDPAELENKIGTLEEVRGKIVNALTMLEDQTDIKEVAESILGSPDNWKRWTDYDQVRIIAEELATNVDEIEDVIQGIADVATRGDDIAQVEDGVGLAASISTVLESAPPVTAPDTPTLSVVDGIEDVITAADPSGASIDLADLPEASINFTADGRSLLDDDINLPLPELDINPEQIDLSDFGQLPPQPENPPEFTFAHYDEADDLTATRDYVFIDEIDGSEFRLARDGSDIVNSDRQQVYRAVSERISTLRNTLEYNTFDPVLETQTIQQLELFEYADEVVKTYDSPVDILAAIDVRIDELVVGGALPVKQEQARSDLFKILYGHLSKPTFSTGIAPPPIVDDIFTTASFYAATGSRLLDFSRDGFGPIGEIAKDVRFIVRKLTKTTAWAYRIRHTRVSFDLLQLGYDIDYESELSEVLPRKFPYVPQAPTRLLATREELVNRMWEARNTLPDPEIEFFRTTSDDGPDNE